MSDGGATTVSADEDTKLARTVGTVLLFFFIVGDTLGAGIYTLVGTMAEDVGGVLWLPLVIAITASGLPIPGWLFSLVALVAIANGALLMVMASRATYGLAEAGLLPSVFGIVASTRRTPWVAIVVVGAATIGMSFVGTISTLADTTVLLLLFVFISTNVSCLMLKRDEVAHEHFRVPVVVPVLAIIASVVLLTQQSLEIWLLGGAFVVVGTVLFLLALVGRRRVEQGPQERTPAS